MLQLYTELHTITMVQNQAESLVYYFISEDDPTILKRLCFKQSQGMLRVRIGE